MINDAAVIEMPESNAQSNHLRKRALQIAAGAVGGIALFWLLVGFLYPKRDAELGACLSDIAPNGDCVPVGYGDGVPPQYFYQSNAIVNTLPCADMLQKTQAALNWIWDNGVAQNASVIAQFCTKVEKNCNVLVRANDYFDFYTAKKEGRYYDAKCITTNTDLVLLDAGGIVSVIAGAVAIAYACHLFNVAFKQQANLSDKVSTTTEPSRTARSFIEGREGQTPVPDAQQRLLQAPTNK